MLFGTWNDTTRGVNEQRGCSFIWKDATFVCPTFFRTDGYNVRPSPLTTLDTTHKIIYII